MNYLTANKHYFGVTNYFYLQVIFFTLELQFIADIAYKFNAGENSRLKLDALSNCYTNNLIMCFVLLLCT